MRKVTAIVQAFKLDDIKDALHRIGVQGMTVSEVRGFGRQRGHTEVYRGAEYVVDFVPKIMIEVAVMRAMAGKVIEVLANAARTGRIGDGKIFSSPLEHVVRIRTGEVGPEAL
jgi:nitrogen regulatory protein P-II 1